MLTRLFDRGLLRIGGKLLSAQPSSDTGIHQLCALSPELTTIVGVLKASRVDVNKKLWVYIKSHNLQETTDKRNIKPDAVLGKKSTLVARIEPIG
ncbi:conserved hypothetical protein [Perkinsus marinus ATCC 50983]|uniref:DM2 domain-containing protein n=1 Tax=Perkinsus marinus (strain ATCC 50983 / TXsc) TaxID=423536 RepID=C5M1M9_PERM5|nr:conserved hypothetical protein [Perkinsus marinus ATCC 50983]EEQ97114.1 conserved hypothetical protein [Perkinsus marinus ATCC 50983]|eukprot:XP_002764397.1 conserved hypothetical protein [Perkinsus marinus ATCC 50983]